MWHSSVCPPELQTSSEMGAEDARRILIPVRMEQSKARPLFPSFLKTLKKHPFISPDTKTVCLEEAKQSIYAVT